MSANGRNVSGQAYSLTVLTPVHAERVNALAQRLNTLPRGDESPLARVRGTHFARWVVIDNVVYEGPPQRRDSLAAPRLLFTSNFDGTLDPYLEEMRMGMAEEADAIWQHCVGYPGRDDSKAWAAWFRNHQIDSSLFFAAYGDQTVGEVRANLDLRARLMSFAIEAQGLDPAQLQARFHEAFPP